MTFGAPWGLAAAALAAPLTLWYVLRARRPRVQVSSTFLWRQTDRSVAAAVPWQRFRPDRTYWMVLVAIVAGALALARPTIAAPAALGDHTIVILDTSASMQATEDGPTRFELARRDIRELIGRMSGAQSMSIIEAGPRARVLAAATTDATAVRRALDQAQASGGGADMADAFTLAASLQRPGEITVTHLYTDGPLPSGVESLAPPGLTVNGVGTDRPNLAVSRLQALPGGASGGQAFVQVRNLGQLPVSAVVTLTLDGEEIARRDVDLGPRQTEDLIVAVEAPSAGARGVLRATVRPDVDPQDAEAAAQADALAIDNTAVAVLSAPRRVRALVAGPGNVFVESALASVEGVTVRTTPAVPTDLSAVDLLVVDRVLAPLRPSVPTLYIAPTRAPADVTIGSPPLELPALTFQDPAAELLTDVDLSGVAIAEAQRVEAPTLQTLASGPGGPLLLAGRLSGTPVVYLPFALNDSNIALQVAWPVLVANSVNFLAGPPAASPLVAGTLATVPVPADAAAITVTPPGGEDIRLDPLRPQVRVDNPGLWEVRYSIACAKRLAAGCPEGIYSAKAEQEPPALSLAVNADPEESDLARGRPKPLEAPGQRRGETTTPSEGRRSLSPFLLIVPLVMLVADALWRPARVRNTGHTRRRFRMLSGRPRKRAAA
jgi:hypothetical protein